MAVAREGITVSGSRRRWYASSRSSLETTMRPGLFKSSASASAKLSPTQLYSARLEVFSNGNTMTTSAAGFCADAFKGREITAKSSKKAENRRNLKLQTPPRSEEHTSELQSQSNLVCRLLLEKKKKKIINNSTNSNIN